MEENKEKNQLLPIFVKLNELNTLIVGGQYVGLEKLSALLNNSPKAAISLVAIEISEEVRTLASKYPNVTLLNREFNENDLEKKDIVIIGTSDNEVNRKIHKICKANKILTNVADTPELCDFYLSSVVQKGSLKIAISTNGKSPTIAKRVKEVLEESFPLEMDEVLDKLSSIRNNLKGDFSEKVKQLNGITSVLIDDQSKKLLVTKVLKIFGAVLAVTIVMIIGYFLISGLRSFS